MNSKFLYCLNIVKNFMRTYIKLLKCLICYFFKHNRTIRVVGGQKNLDRIRFFWTPTMTLLGRRKLLNSERSRSERKNN